LIVPKFATPHSAGINDPEKPEKYNNTEVKYMSDGSLHLLKKNVSEESILLP
jgi:hypothetical protein